MHNNKLYRDKTKMPGRDKTGSLGQGRGRGLGRRIQNTGDVRTCICTSCGHKQAHVRGQPCNQIKCPKCKKLMTRK